MVHQQNETEAPEDQVDVLIAEYLEADALGQPPNRQEFLARHANVADDLRSFFRDHDRMRRAADPHEPTPLPAERLPPAAPTLGAEQAQPGVLDGAARRFGDYELLEEVARGGMGVVYKARQIHPDRIVALKMILAGPLAAAADVQRFRTEVEIAARLDHPNIVPIYEAGEHDGLHFFSMKFIEGGHLGRRPEGADRRSTQREAAGIMAKVARAVHYAHQRGLLHRDLKPANILLDPQGEPLVSDFGLAKLVQGEPGVSASRELTVTGVIVGTPSYMAPEQAAARKGLTTAADVYSLGAILYELLTGRPPFRADTPLETLRQVQECEPERPSALRPGVDRDLETICLKCLHKEPAGRYDSAGSLADDLERWLVGEPIHARRTSAWERGLKWARRRPAIAALVLVSLLLFAGGFGGILWQWQQAELARGQAQDRADAEAAECDRAEKERDRAEKERDEKIAALARAAEERARAEKERDEKIAALTRAEGLQLSAHAAALRTNNPGLSLLLAIEGSRRAPGLLANNALRNALTECREERTLIHETGPSFAQFSPDGQYLLTAHAEGFRQGNLALLWEVASGKLIRRFRVHWLDIASAAFSPDGQLVVFTYNGHAEISEPGKRHYFTDRVARVWDVTTGRERFVLKGHRDRVVSAEFSPDGRQILTASYDGTARLWDTATGQEMTVLQAHASALLTARFLPTGRALTAATGYRHTNTTYPLYELQERQGQVVTDLPADQGPVNPFSSSSSGGSGSHMASDDVFVRVWDLAQGKQVAALRAPATPPLETCTLISLAVSPDGGRVLTVFPEGPIPSHPPVQIWDVASGKAVLALTGQHGVRFAAFSPDGQRVLTVADDKTARICDAATGKEIIALKERSGFVAPAQFSPDSRRVLCGCGDKTIRLWDAETGTELFALRGHEQAISSAAFSPDGRRVASAAGDWTSRLWDVTPAWEIPRRLQGHQGPVTHLAFSPDGRRLATGSADRTARLWDLATGHELFILKGHDWLGNLPVRDEVLGEIRSLQFSPDGRRLLTASGDPIARLRTDGILGFGAEEKDVPFTPVRVWDTATGKELFNLTGHEAQVVCAEYSPDGHLILSAEHQDAQVRTFRSQGGQVGSSGRTKEDAAVHVWDAASGQRLTSLRGHKAGVTWATFSPDSRRILTADFWNGQLSNDIAARIWDSATGQVLATMHGTRGEVRRAAFRPDGQQVLMDGNSSFWDVATGQRLSPLQRPIGAFAFHPNGAQVAAVTETGSAALFDVATGKQLCPLRGHFLPVRALAYSRDGRLLATASDDATARVWDAETGRELHTLAGHEGALLAVAFSPDGTQVATASADGTARIWPLDLLPIARARQPRALTAAERERYEIAEK